MGHLHAHFHVTSLSVLKTGEVYFILYSRWMTEMTEMTKKLKSRPWEQLSEVYKNTVISVICVIEEHESLQRLVHFVLGLNKCGHRWRAPYSTDHAEGSARVFCGDLKIPANTGIIADICKNTDGTIGMRRVLRNAQKRGNYHEIFDAELLRLCLGLLWKNTLNSAFMI